MTASNRLLSLVLRRMGREQAQPHRSARSLSAVAYEGLKFPVGLDALMM